MNFKIILIITLVIMTSAIMPVAGHAEIDEAGANAVRAAGSAGRNLGEFVLDFFRFAGYSLQFVGEVITWPFRELGEP